MRARRGISDDDVLAIRDLLATAWISYALHAFVVLGMPDELGRGATDPAAVASGVGTSPIETRRLLRALVSIGIVVEDDGQFALTSRGELLRSELTDSQRRRVLLQAGDAAHRSWLGLVERVRSGPGDDDPFDFVDEAFDAAMAEGCGQMRDAIAAAFDASGVRTIVDLGGGHGALLPAFLRQQPAMTGVVFDKEHCRVGAEKLLAREGLTERCRFVGGDFFTDDLPSADVYVLKSVVHDWDDARTVALFQHVRAAMTPTTQLLIVEVVVPPTLTDTRESRRYAHADLHMLVATGGAERTVDEYAALLARANLELVRTSPTATPPPFSVLTARPT